MIRNKCVCQIGRKKDKIKYFSIVLLVVGVTSKSLGGSQIIFTRNRSTRGEKIDPFTVVRVRARRSNVVFLLFIVSKTEAYLDLGFTMRYHER